MAGPRSPSPAREAARGTAGRPPEELPPWLQEAEPAEPEPARTLLGRGTLLAILGGLLLLVIGVAAGVFLAVRRDAAPAPVAPGEVPLVRSPGPWKEPAEGLPEALGEQVEGQGSVLFEAGTGEAPVAAIDVSRLPEEPLLPGAPPPPPPEAAPTLLLPEEPRRPAPRPEPAPPPAPAATEAAAAPAGGGPQALPQAAPAEAPRPPGRPATLQLGAFASPARAREAFRELAERHAPLADLEPSVSPVAREDGTVLHRLRVAVPDRAAAERLCARIRVAGDACVLVDEARPGRDETGGAAGAAGARRPGQGG